MKKTYYTAIGHFQRVTDAAGRSYPVILINRKEYMVDIQEMSLWTALNWQLLELPEIQQEYDRLTLDCPVQERRTMEDCLGRLCTRSLVASGTAETGFEALYEMLGSLQVVPLSDNLLLRVGAFLKLTLLRGVSFAKAKALFRRDRPSEREAQVMALSRQALLSVVELVKCVENGVEDVSSDKKVMEALYDDDDTTCDNIADNMLTAKCRKNVLEAVANLYLRKQIIFERV